MLSVTLVAEKIWQVQIQSDPQRFLREALGERRLLRELVRERHRRLAKLRVRHDSVDHPDSLGFLRVDDVAAEDQFIRARETDQPRQHQQAARLGNQSAPDENLAEARLVRAHAHVAHQRDIASVADRGAVDRRDGRLRIRDEKIQRDRLMRAPLLDLGRAWKAWRREIRD